MEKFANNAVTVLNGSILAGDLSLVVHDASSFPNAGQFRILIESEILLVTVVAGTTFTVTRGAEGTTGVGHADGSTVTHILTAGALEQLKADAHISRYTPLDSDVALCWTFDESAPPYANTGTAGSCDLVLGGSNAIVHSRQGLFGTAASMCESGVNSPFSTLVSDPTTAGETAGAFTLCTWVLARVVTGAYATIAMKGYSASSSWSEPYITCALQQDGSGNGTWAAMVTVTGPIRHTLTVGDIGPPPHTEDRIRPGEWALLALTYDPATGVLNAYKNGDLAATTTIAGTTIIDWGTHGRWSIGCDFDRELFDGLIDDTRFYWRALTSVELTAMYQNGVGHGDY